MAETRPVDPFKIDLSMGEAEVRPYYHRLSLLNGLLIGLALGLGAWGIEVMRVTRLPVAAYLPVLGLGLAMAFFLGGLVGWLTGQIARTPITVFLWAAVGVLFMWLMSYLPYYGRSLTVWLADSRFWGRPLFPFTLEATPGSLVLGGFFIILTLTGLGLVQNYRLENLASEMSHRGRLGGRGWLSLVWPLPIVFLISMATHNTMSNPAATGVELTNRAITVAQAYEGDLRQLDLGDGISYAAVRPVQAMIGGDFSLNVVDINPLTSAVIVGVDFANGAWVNCRVINDQLTFCYDASPPYIHGLRSLVTGQPPAEDCRGCVLRATDEAAAWLAERRDRLGSAPVIERVAQQGSHVLMRVTGEDDFAVECWVVGVAPTELTECSEIE